jgi:hypothetical protein
VEASELRPAATRLSREERLRAEDLEECGRVGAEFRLGEVEFTSHAMEAPSWPGAIGCLMIMASVLGGIPAGIAVGLSSASPTAKLVVYAIFGAMFFLGWPLGAIGVLADVVASRIGLYPDGVAQLRRTEPEPVVLRWADIETVTVELTTDEGTPLTGLEKCALRGRNGAEITEAKAVETVVAAVHRALAPRLVPPLIAACDRGEPVTAGAARVDDEGITLPAGKRLTWPEVKSVTMGHASKDSADVITRIDIRVVRRNRLHHFDPSGIPNAIFFAHVLAHAAMRNGVQVDGYQQAA